MLGQSTAKFGYESTAQGFYVDQHLSLTVEVFPIRYEAPDHHSSIVRPARPCTCDEACHRWSAHNIPCKQRSRKRAYLIPQGKVWAGTKLGRTDSDHRPHPRYGRRVDVRGQRSEILYASREFAIRVRLCGSVKLDTALDEGLATPSFRVGVPMEEC
jgi:hypothetical protein